MVTWLVRCPAPGDERMEKWGDFHFARSLCKALERQGTAASFRIHDRWDDPIGAEVEVVLTLRGKFAAPPVAGRLNLLWLISHPAEVTTDEIAGYDRIAVASEAMASELAAAMPGKVFPLLQCTDPEVFRPLDREPRFDLLFVGNSRGVPRPGVLWARELTGYRFKVWGRHWARWLDRTIVEGDYWPNERLAELYAATHLVVNDHYEDMKRHGFVNNRVFDALACKRCVLTDGHQGLRRLFPDEVLYYRDRESFAAAVGYFFRHREEIAERVERGYRKVITEHTFDRRATRLLAAAEEVRGHRRRDVTGVAVGAEASGSSGRATEAPAVPPAGASRSGRPAVTVISWDVCRNHFSKAYAVAEVLSRHFPVRLVGFRFFGEVFGPFREEAPPFETVYLDAASFPRFHERLYEAAEAVTGDVVYVVKPKLASLGVALLRQLRHGTPIVLEINDLETAVLRPERGVEDAGRVDLAGLAASEAMRDLADPIHPSWDRLFEGYAELAQQLVTHNQNLNRRFGGRAAVLRNVKDERFYSAGLYDRAAVRRELGIAPEDRVILFGGLVRRHKGVFELAELLGRLDDARYTLLVAGARPDAPDQQRLLAEHRERVRFLPPQNRNAMARVNLASDVVVLWLDPRTPASHYQMPYKLTDALAMEVPVVANAISDLEDLGRRGYLKLVPFGDLAGMGRALDELFGDPAATREMTRRGRDLFLREFSYDAAERVLVPIVERLAGVRVEADPRIGELARFLGRFGGEGRGRSAAAPAAKRDAGHRLAAAGGTSAMDPRAAGGDAPLGAGDLLGVLRRVRLAAEGRRRERLGELAHLFRSHLELARRFRGRPQEELVSVVMPAWNREYVIAQAIESVQRQEYRNWELLVADDGSDDGTAGVAERYAAADSRIRVLRLGRNGGAARARNAALAVAGGSLIAYLDTDNGWTELYLSIMTGLFAERPGRLIGYAGYFDVDLDAGTTRIRMPRFDRRTLLERNYVDLNVLMHRRTLYEELGGFDERLIRQHDWDLALRYTEREEPFVVPAVLSYYYRKSGWQQLTDLRKVVETRSLVLERWAGAESTDGEAASASRQGLLYCPICRRSAESFRPFGRQRRENAQCPSCGALERHRLAWCFLEERTDLCDGRPKSLLHVAPERALSGVLQEIPDLDYVSADLEPGLAMICADLTALQFGDGRFDVILCSHVLEHIPDDRAAISELFRVLAPGGWVVVQVPTYGSTTCEDPSITEPRERERAFGQGDHVRKYGTDLAGRLREGGFRVEVVRYVREVTDEKRERYALRDQVLFYCTKPASS